eukprot:1232511-Karenia_brevis.AAC.1
MRTLLLQLLTSFFELISFQMLIRNAKLFCVSSRSTWYQYPNKKLPSSAIRRAMTLSIKPIERAPRDSTLKPRNSFGPAQISLLLFVVSMGAALFGFSCVAIALGATTSSGVDIGRMQVLSSHAS